MDNKTDINLQSDLIKSRAQERLDHILKVGCTHNGASDKFDSNIKPEWYDEKRFKNAQKIVRQNTEAVTNCIIIGYLLNLQTPFNLIPLLQSGQSKNTSTLFNRYLNLILHMNAWYNYDPFDKNSKAYKSQKLIKTMHINSNKMLNNSNNLSIYEFVKKMIEETGKVEYNNEEFIEKVCKNKNRIWASQADMALFNWAFFGPIFLEPNLCGIHCSKDEILEIAYLWKVLNYKIGIDDEFSIVNELDYDLIYTICKLMLEQEFIPYAENVSAPIGIKMGQGAAIGFSKIIPSIRWSSFISYWYKAFNINAYKLNQSKLDSDKYEFIDIKIKNELTDDERILMKNNGYNDKYIVQNPDIKFEEVKIEEEDKEYYKIYDYNVNNLFKKKFKMKLIRLFNKRKMNKILAEKHNHTNYLKTNYDDKMNFPACPFLNVTVDNEYHEFDKI